MRKYIYALVLILLCISGADSRRAEAYSVTLQENGMYAEVLPDSIVNNASVFFDKNVKEAMRYYHKYKDADDYTYATKVPTEYQDFIPVAKKIQDSDEIIIKNPFYIYDVTLAAVGESYYEYYFVAEKNGKKLCLFCIGIDPGSGKPYFSYDKMLDQYFLYDEKTMEDGLFYIVDNITYAQTPEKTTVVRDRSNSGGQRMEGGIDFDKVMKEFEEKSYEGKKDEIFASLKKMKKGKIIKEVGEKFRPELGDEYIEPGEKADYTDSETDAGESDSGKSVYMVIGVVVGVIVVGTILGKALIL